MPKSVAVILVNWNTPVHTANCINSLLGYCEVAKFDIILVDNGSTDGSLQVLQSQFPDLIFIDNQENLGFAEGNNRGLQYSINRGYEYSLVINTDTLVDEDIITALSAHLDCYTLAAAVQPAIRWMHQPDKLWNGPCYFNVVLGVTRAKTDDKLKDLKTYQMVDWVTGCCVMFRNSALRTAGLFNKQFFLYYEDVELSYRLRSCGYQVHYLPTSKMYHEAGVSGKSEKKKAEGFLNPFIHYYTSRNHIWFIRRYGKPIFYPIYWLYNGAYYAAVLTYLKLRGRNKKVSLLLKGLKEGVFTSQTLIWPNN
ncbi:glycosyltransferase family 2 protein [Mucilaginibacter agri]|uniref:Glycosyltransferase n=1 Tax=Mucilaginibacter agri TaxID=2695265 RepID=A0A965ZJG6_9SPHI|nr:glycosyltransferase family 2 protein [Mucilaginibacter agri]NCD72273.1 glycosyltransferase [Mucilaginibacter agri]